MGQAAQLTSAVEDLKTAAGQYAGVADSLASLIGFGEGVVYPLRTLNNQGQYIQAAVGAWNAGAEDAYRVSQATANMSQQILHLAQGIEDQIGPISTAEMLLNLTTDPSDIKAELIRHLTTDPNDIKSVQSSADTALANITGLVNGFRMNVPNVVTSHVSGGCSTGNGRLQSGGSDPEWQQFHETLANIYASLDEIERLANAGDEIEEETNAGAGGGKGDGNGWWDKLCEAGDSTSPAASSSLMEKLKTLFVNADGTVNKSTIIHLIGFPTTMGMISGGYNAGLFFQQHGFTTTMQRALYTSLLITSVDGPLFFMLAKKAHIGPKDEGGKRPYAIADCVYPMAGAQGIVGLFGTVGAQALLSALGVGETPKKSGQ